MKDCFCSEFIASVNNDNINRLDTLRIVFNITNTNMNFFIKDHKRTTIYMENGKTFSVKTADNTILAENVSTFDYQFGDNNIVVYGFSETGTLWITNKYNIKNLTLNSNYMDFEVSQLKYVQINKLVLNINPLGQNVNDLNLPYLTQLTDSNNALNGKLEDLATTPLALFSGASNIIGDILELAQAQVKAGRESATINGTGWKRKFNGTNIGTHDKYQIAWVKSGSNYVVTCKAGSNIESPSFNQSVTIDAQGNIVS